MITISDDENDVSIVFENVEYKSDARRAGRKACTCRLREGGTRYISTNADDVTQRGTSSRHHKKPHRYNREPINSFYDAYGSLSDLDEEGAPTFTSQHSSPCSKPANSCRIRPNKTTIDAMNKIRNSVDSGLETCEEEEDVLDEYVPQRGAMVFVKVEDSLWWRPGRVEEWVIQLFQPVRCKVNIDRDTAVLVSADLLAYWNPPTRILPVHCPVIACPGERQDGQDSKYYAGVVHRSPSADNKYYYLIYFERDDIRRVHYTRIRAVCDGCNNMADLRNRNSIWSHLEECLLRYEAKACSADGAITERSSPEVVLENCIDAVECGNDGITTLTQPEEEHEEEEKEQEQVERELVEQELVEKEQVEQELVEQEQIEREGLGRREEGEKEHGEGDGADEDFNHEETEHGDISIPDDQAGSKEEGFVDENPTNPEENFSLATVRQPRPGDRVFVKVAGSLAWKRGQVDEIIKKSDTSVMKYMINVHQADTVVVTGTCLAFRKSLPRKIRLPIGTRVIANPGRNHWDEESDYYGGLILEGPQPGSQERRHLVFFERGDAKYLKLKRVRLICESSKNIWEDMDIECQEFVRSFIVNGHQKDVEVEVGEFVKVKLNGKKWNAKVSDVDRSLAKVKFRDNRTEWIFRNDNLLFPIGTEPETQSNEKSPSTPVKRRKSISGPAESTTSRVENSADESSADNITTTKSTTVDSITPSNDAAVAANKAFSTNDTLDDNSDANTVDYVTNDSTSDSSSLKSFPAPNSHKKRAFTNSAVSLSVATAAISPVPTRKNSTVPTKPAVTKGFTINDIIATTNTSVTPVRASNTTVTSKSVVNDISTNSCARTNPTTKGKSSRVKSGETATRCVASSHKGSTSAVIQCELVEDGITCLGHTSPSCANKCTSKIPRIGTTEALSAPTVNHLRNVPTDSALIPFSIPTSASSHDTVPPYSAAIPYGNFPIYPTAMRYGANNPSSISYDTETNHLSPIPFYGARFNSIDTSLLANNAAPDFRNNSSNNLPVFPWVTGIHPINVSASFGNSSPYPTRIFHSIDTDNVPSKYRDIGVTRQSNTFEQSEIMSPYKYTPAACSIPAAPIRTTDPIVSNFHDFGIRDTGYVPSARHIPAAASDATDRFATDYRDVGFPHLSNISDHIIDRTPAFIPPAAARHNFVATNYAAGHHATNYCDIGLAPPARFSEHTSERISAFKRNDGVRDISAPTSNADRVVTSYRDIDIFRPSNIEHTSGNIHGFKRSADARDVLAATSNTTDRVTANERDVNIARPSNTSEHRTQTLSASEQTADTRDATSNINDPIATKYRETGMEVSRRTNSSQHGSDEYPAFKHTSTRHVIPAATSIITDRAAPKHRDGNNRHSCTSGQTTQRTSPSNRTPPARDIHGETSSATEFVAGKSRDVDIPRDSNISKPNTEKTSSSNHISAARDVPATIRKTIGPIATKYHDIDSSRHSNASEKTADEDTALKRTNFCDISVTRRTSASYDIPPVTTKTRNVITTKYRDLDAPSSSNTSEHTTESISASKQTSARRTASTNDTTDPIATKYRTGNIGISRHVNTSEHTTANISSMKHTSAACDIPPVISETRNVITTKYRDLDAPSPSNTSEHTAAKYREIGISRHLNASESTTEIVSSIEHTSAACDIPPVINETRSTITTKYRDLDAPPPSNTSEHRTKEIHASKQTFTARQTIATSDTTDPVATKYRDIGLSRHPNAFERTSDKITTLKDTPAKDGIAAAASIITDRDAKGKDMGVSRQNASQLTTEKIIALKDISARHVNSATTNIITDRVADKYRNIGTPRHSNTSERTIKEQLDSKRTTDDISAATSNTIATKYGEIGAPRHLNASEHAAEKIPAMKPASAAIPAVKSSAIDIIPCYVDMSSSNPLMTSTKKSSTASTNDSICTNTTRPRKNDPTKLFTLPYSIDSEIPLRKFSRIKMTAYIKNRAADDSDADSNSFISDATDSASESAPADDKSKGGKNESGYTFGVNLHPENRFPNHKCGRRCVNRAPFKKRMVYSVNPLSVSVSCGWIRDVLLDGEPRVRYTTPCGVTIFNMKDIEKYLKTAFSKMTVDLFNFEPEVSLTRYDYNRDFIRIADLSHGAEEVRISVYNDVDGSLPASFRYSAASVRPSDLKVIQVKPHLQSCCACKDDCRNRKKCSCRRVRDSDEDYQYRRLMKKSNTVIWECHERCGCVETCHNRVAQNRLQLSLQVFKTLDKGWGVRCLYDIPKGTFICPYVGEVLTIAEAMEEEKKHGKEYFVVLKQPKGPEKKWEEIDIFGSLKTGKEDGKSSSSRIISKRKNEDDKESAERKKLKKEVERKSKSNKDTNDVALKEHSYTKSQRSSLERSQQTLTYKINSKTETYVLNSRSFGNVSRFFNYSCNPNMFAQCVSSDPRFQTLAFFSKERIPAGEELTWDYWAVPL